MMTNSARFLSHKGQHKSSKTHISSVGPMKLIKSLAVNTVLNDSYKKKMGALMIKHFRSGSLEGDEMMVGKK